MIACVTWQVLGEEWRKTALEFQEKVHRVAITILKALFTALGRDEAIIDDVRSCAFQEHREMAFSPHLHSIDEWASLPASILLIDRNCNVSHASQAVAELPAIRPLRSLPYF